MSRSAAPRTRLEELGSRRRWGVEHGHLPALTTVPTEHRDIVGGVRNSLTDRLEEIAEHAEKRKTERTFLWDREKQLITDWNAADQKLADATDTRQSLSERLDALCASARIRELTEASEGETTILWGESPVILRRLGDAVLTADEERVRRRATQYADKRTITEHDRSQFLPSSLDADQVREALTAVTAAQTGWEYLRGAVSPRDLLALLDTPAIARLGSGVVVPTAAAENAVDCLEGGDIRTTSLVSVYTAVAADALIAAARAGVAAEDAPAWTALRQGLVDQDEAAATVRFLRERAQASQREDAELVQRQAADQVLHDTVVAFLEDCPAGKLETIDTDIAHWDAKRLGVEQAQRATQQQLEDLDEADGVAETARIEASKALQRAESTLGQAPAGPSCPVLRDKSCIILKPTRGNGTECVFGGHRRPAPAADAKAAAVGKAVRSLARTGAPLTSAAIARLAGVSRSFIYENDQARAHVTAAQARTQIRAAGAIPAATAQQEASWRERALNAEQKIRDLQHELTAQRRLAAGFLGQLRQPDGTWLADETTRLHEENERLLTERNQLARERNDLARKLEAARASLARLTEQKVTELFPHGPGHHPGPRTRPKPAHPASNRQPGTTRTTSPTCQPRSTQR